MKNMLFDQEKPSTVTSMGFIFLGLGLYSWNNVTQFSVLFLFGILLLAYKVSYEISEDFNPKKILSFFGFPIRKTKLEIEFPDYISVFSGGFSKANMWGSIAAIGSKSSSDKVAIKLFTGNKNFTLYKSESSQKAKRLAEELSQMLRVELFDKTK